MFWTIIPTIYPSSCWLRLLGFVVSSIWKAKDPAGSPLEFSQPFSLSLSLNAPCFQCKPVVGLEKVRQGDGSVLDLVQDERWPWYLLNRPSCHCHSRRKSLLVSGWLLASVGERGKSQKMSRSSHISLGFCFVLIIFFSEAQKQINSHQTKLTNGIPITNSTLLCTYQSLYIGMLVFMQLFIKNKRGMKDGYAQNQ